jgi:hypothetical protein
MSLTPLCVRSYYKAIRVQVLICALRISGSEQIVFNLPSYNKALFNQRYNRNRELNKQDCVLQYYREAEPLIY